MGEQEVSDLISVLEAKPELADRLRRVMSAVSQDQLEEAVSQVQVEAPPEEVAEVQPEPEPVEATS